MLEMTRPSDNHYYSSTSSSKLKISQAQTQEKTPYILTKAMKKAQLSAMYHTQHAKQNEKLEKTFSLQAELREFSLGLNVEVSEKFPKLTIFSYANVL